jgi:hypothetical protein
MIITTFSTFVHSERKLFAHDRNPFPGLKSSCLSFDEWELGRALEPKVTECVFADARNTLTSALDSTIISHFPEIFAEFRGKQFLLLWRSGDESFRAKTFTAAVTPTYIL